MHRPMKFSGVAALELKHRSWRWHAVLPSVKAHKQAQNAKVQTNTPKDKFEQFEGTTHESMGL